jgi:hypothetical protein
MKPPPAPPAPPVTSTDHDEALRRLQAVVPLRTRALLNVLGDVLSTQLQGVIHVAIWRYARSDEHVREHFLAQARTAGTAPDIEEREVARLMEQAIDAEIDRMRREAIRRG